MFLTKTTLGEFTLDLGGFVHLVDRIFICALGMGVMTQSGLAREVGSHGADDNHIQIVTGMYGMPGRKHVLDITAKLQDLCGTGAQRCSVFCSDSSFGRYNVGYKPICRVTYRCGSEDVRSVEAWREEPILMRCPQPAMGRQDEQVQPAPPASN